MNSSLYVFASDVAGAGADAVVADARDRAGVDAVSPAFVYHASRDVFPHNPRRRVVLSEHGGFHFSADARRYARLAIQPRPARHLVGGEGLAELCDAARRAGLDVHAWTVMLHTDRPELEPWSQVDAFGAPSGDVLCPSHPDVREYAVALAADIARRGVASVDAESLHFHEFDHGRHHERCLAPIDGVTRVLLGLCFCAECERRGRQAGVDAGGLRARICATADAVLSADEPAGPPGLPPRAVVAALFDGELDAYLRVREHTVTALVAEVAAAVRGEGSDLAFIDPSGALLGYADGRPGPTLAVDTAWRVGVDLEAVGRAAGEVHLAAYARDPGRVGDDARAYRRVVGPDVRLGAALRPWAPDAADGAALARKLAALRDADVQRVSFYHYGLLPLAALDHIAAALVGAA